MFKRAVIVDNSQFQRNTYKELLESTKAIQVIAMFGSSEEILATETAAQLLRSADFILMDIDLGNESKNGIELAKYLWKNGYPNKPILFYTGYEGDYLPQLSQLKQLGYYGIVTRTFFPRHQKLIEAIQSIIDGGEYIGEDLRNMIRVYKDRAEMAPKNLFAPSRRLTEPEKDKEPGVEEVFEYNGLGMSTTQIAEKLNVSERWVNNKLNEMYGILGLYRDANAGSEVLKRRAAIIYQTDCILTWNEQGLPEVQDGILYTDYKNQIKELIRRGKLKSEE